MQKLLASLGGRKYTVAVLGLIAVVVVAFKTSAPGDAYLAISGIVIGFCGGNAIVDRAHAKQGREPL
jgi:nitrate/nitrite transporter NarK